MTIQANYYVVGAAGNGTTTVFGIPWPFRAQTDVVVVLIDQSNADQPVTPPPTLNGGGTYDYVITGTPDPDTGFYASANVVFNHAPLTQYVVYISRATLDWQDKSLPTNGRFPAKSVEAALDRRTLVDQEQSVMLGGVTSGGAINGGRIVMMSPFDLSAFNPILPSTQGAGGDYLALKPDGSGWQWLPGPGNYISGVVGTANQITVTNSGGIATLSLPVSIFIPANFPYTPSGASGIELAQYNSAGVGRYAVLNDLGNYVQMQMNGSGIATVGDSLPDAGYCYSNGSGGMILGTNGNSPTIFMVAGVFVGRFRLDGTLLVNPPGPLTYNGIDLLANANQNVTIKIQNQNGGTASSVSLYMQNNGSGAGSNTFLTMYGTNVASGGYQAASRAVLWTDGAGGMAIATNAAVPILFFPNGVEAARFAANGYFGIGQANPANIVDVLQNTNGPAVINLVNPNSGTAAYAKVQFGNATNQSVLIHFGLNYPTSGIWHADGCALVGAGAGGLMLATQSATAQPIYFGIQAQEVARFDTAGQLGIGKTPTKLLDLTQTNAGAFTQMGLANPSAVANSGVIFSLTNDVGSPLQLLIYSSTTGSGVGNAGLVQGGGTGGLWLKTSANAPVKFQVNNGNECGRWDTDNFFKALGGYTGGIPAGNHYLYSTTNGNGVVGVVHNQPSPTGVQVLYSADPNGTGNFFWQGMGGYGSTYTSRGTLMSNGGIQNYSANNINLSDANLKDHIEPLKAKVIADLWDAHRDMPWTRYHYKDQTHRDFNYGYLAQDIERVFGTEFVEDLEQPEIQHPEKPEEKVKPTHATIKGVYAEDLHNIGHALLSEAQRRIERLEALIATLTTKEKRK